MRLVTLKVEGPNKDIFVNATFDHDEELAKSL
jgi:hypothetical protein